LNEGQTGKFRLPLASGRNGMLPQNQMRFINEICLLHSSVIVRDSVPLMNSNLLWRISALNIPLGHGCPRIIAFRSGIRIVAIGFATPNQLKVVPMHGNRQP